MTVPFKLDHFINSLSVGHCLLVRSLSLRPREFVTNISVSQNQLQFFRALVFPLNASLPLFSLFFESLCFRISPRSIKSTVFLKKLEKSTLFACRILLGLTLAVCHEYLVKISRDPKHFGLLERGATLH